MAIAKQNPWHVFLIFLRLGLTSFGGPIAHLSYFRDEFVIRRQWLSERSYADLVALCQFLPGPASSQVGIALGLSRSGYVGALAAWAGFTLPSAIALIFFALGLSSHAIAIPEGGLHGLKVVAVAVVAQAVWGMALIAPSALGQVGTIVVAGISGLILFKPTSHEDHSSFLGQFSQRSGVLWLTLFFCLLAGLPMLASLLPYQAIADISVFFQSGALVFGGGHVVLPLLQTAIVPQGWVSNDAFLAGYGAAQAVPGPLFTFAAFLGASMNVTPSGWLGGIVCLLAIFIPSFLLVLGALPFWEQLRCNVRMQAGLMGINAAVVGLLLAALYNPVWTSAIHTPKDFGIALVAFITLMFWKLPPWLVVASCGVTGWLVSML